VKNVYRRTVAVMGTTVTIELVSQPPDQETFDRAFEWFYQIEGICSRFDTQSELMQLTAQTGVEVPVSAILYEAVQFAIAVAEETGGAFDPTVGHVMETRGFNRNYRTGKAQHTFLESDATLSYRDVRLNPDDKTITLLRPLILDLGAVAKGLAIDMAARELHAATDFAINAGGDLYLGGCNAEGKPWSIGIRHPRRDGELIDSILVSNRAVCTSGDYERGDHIVDPSRRAPNHSTASVTVVAPNAMLADALATAAFVVGPAEGIRLFDRMGVDGLIFSPDLRRYATQGTFGG
jgi:thiamine biosynthesis lipoprotein